MATVTHQPVEELLQPLSQRPLGLVDNWLNSQFNAKLLEVGALLAMIGMGVASWYILGGPLSGEKALEPSWAAALLVANLLPATLLLILIGRRIAIMRAARSEIGSQGRLHVKLIFIFAMIAAIPTLLLVIFASFLFQSGVQFWFSDPARNILQNAGSLAQGYYDEKVRDVTDETVTMAGDLRNNLVQSSIDDPRFYNAYALQVIRRKLSDSAIVEIGEDNVQRTASAINPAERAGDAWLNEQMLAKLRAGNAVAVNILPQKIEVAVPLMPQSDVYLYASRQTTSASYQLGSRAQAVLQDYGILAEQSRLLQLQFNASLYFGSLFIIGLALWIALLVADRLVRPLVNLAHAAGQVAEGRLSTRVEVPDTSMDEMVLLSNSFNRMTERLEEQTGTIIAANNQLDSRREFTESILESVASGILSIDAQGHVNLANSNAQMLLSPQGDSLVGKPLIQVAPAFSHMLDEGQYQSVIQMEDGAEPRTFAVRMDASGSSKVISFEDISQQIMDQRRAAWADVARRIAHEIKNPLTPINLAAERLKRRFSKAIAEEDKAIFEQLTNTIIRQVSDLRKIVDEFSNFARMPKPIFRAENLVDIIKQSMFLMEVAHPEISFQSDLKGLDHELVCDRRQLGQALTNIIKNAIEAIEIRAEKDTSFSKAAGRILISLHTDKSQIKLTICDNGQGLPKERANLFEPYMTLREKGTGLGLAIVKKIIEEHFGQIELEDSENGQGAQISIIFHTIALEQKAANMKPRELES